MDQKVLLRFRKKRKKREKKKRPVSRYDKNVRRFPIVRVSRLVRFNLAFAFDALREREEEEKKEREREKRRKNRDPSIDRENREAVFGGSSHARSERVVGRWALVNSK